MKPSGRSDRVCRGGTIGNGTIRVIPLAGAEILIAIPLCVPHNVVLLFFLCVPAEGIGD
jgi:hypothetical protein